MAVNSCFVFFLSAIYMWALILSDSDIGQGFFVPDYNLLGDDMHGGFNFFKDIPAKCISKKGKQGKIRSLETYVKDTSAFYSVLSTTSGISGEYQTDYTMGFTLDATTQSISGKNRSVTGLTYSAFSETKSKYLEKSCFDIMEVVENLASDFKKLPSSIKEAQSTNGWIQYENFLNNHGSHIVTQVDYGSSIYQHTFAESTQTYTEHDFAVKTCLSLSSIDGKMLNASVCSNVTEEDISKASHLSMSTVFVARGGSAKTRAQLYKDRTDENIVKFLNEAGEFHNPISYQYVPIWTLLSKKFPNLEYQSKIINLKSYYLGYKNFKCNLIKGENAELQQFEVLKPSSSTPVFQCTIAPIGCQSVKDCKWDLDWYGFGFTWSCYCKNNHCVKHKKIKLNTGQKRETAYVYPKGWDHSWNGNCKNIDLKPYCKCQTTKQRLVVWSSESFIRGQSVTMQKKTEL